MRIISRSRLVDYGAEHADARGALEAWFRSATRAEWKSSAEVKAYDPKASIINATRVVFDIKGGSHRLVVRIRYDKGIIWIRFIGTHRQYDEIDAGTV
jgi:mRNA interferase HigB